MGLTLAPQRQDNSTAPNHGDTCCGGGSDEPPPAKLKEQYDAMENPCEALRRCVKSCQVAIAELKAAMQEGQKLTSLATEVIDLQQQARFCKEGKKEALLLKFEKQTQELLEGLTALEQKTKNAIGDHHQPGFEERFAYYSMALRAQGDWTDPEKRKELDAYERELRALSEIHAQCSALARDQQRQIAACAANLTVASEYASSALTLWAQAKIAVRSRPTPLIGDRSRDTVHFQGTLGRMEMRNSTSWGNLGGTDIDTSGFGNYGRRRSADAEGPLWRSQSPQPGPRSDSRNGGTDEAFY